MRPSPRRTTALAVALLLVLPAACGSEDDGGAIVAPETTAAPDGDASTTSTTSATSAPPASETTAVSTGTVIDVQVVGGQPTGGSQAVDVAVGSEVTIRVAADVADEVHVHGYDLFADVAPHAPAEITFVAEIPGQFEVELEGGHVLLVELTVS